MKNKEAEKLVGAIYKRLGNIEEWISHYDPSQNPDEEFNIPEYAFAEEIELLLISIDQFVKKAGIKAYYQIQN